MLIGEQSEEVEQKFGLPCMAEYGMFICIYISTTPENTRKILWTLT